LGRRVALHAFRLDVVADVEEDKLEVVMQFGQLRLGLTEILIRPPATDSGALHGRRQARLFGDLLLKEPGHRLFVLYLEGFDE